MIFHSFPPSLPPVCSLLSIFGFLVAICLATTVAAQGGAVAGLGVALLSKPLMFEVCNTTCMCISAIAMAIVCIQITKV